MPEYCSYPRICVASKSSGQTSTVDYNWTFGMGLDPTLRARDKIVTKKVKSIFQDQLSHLGGSGLLSKGGGGRRPERPGPCGPRPCEPLWALFGSPWALAGRALVPRALVGHPGPLWAPLGPCGPDPCRSGACGLPCALVGSPGPLQARPLWAGHMWAPLGPHGPGPNGPSWDTHVYISAEDF